MTQRYLFVFIIGLMLLSPVGVQAQTTAELQAQIQSLLKTVSQLQTVISQQSNNSNQTSLTASTPNNSDLTCPPVSQTLLIKGSRGNIVYLIQDFLIRDGYLNTDQPTTYYGPLTAVAVSKFKTKYGIGTNGNAGIQTTTKMREICLARVAAPASETDSSSSSSSSSSVFDTHVPPAVTVPSVTNQPAIQVVSPSSGTENSSNPSINQTYPTPYFALANPYNNGVPSSVGDSKTLTFQLYNQQSVSRVDIFLADESKHIISNRPLVTVKPASYVNNTSWTVPEISQDGLYRLWLVAYSNPTSNVLPYALTEAFTEPFQLLRKGASSVTIKLTNPNPDAVYQIASGSSVPVSWVVTGAPSNSQVVVDMSLIQASDSSGYTGGGTYQSKELTSGTNIGSYNFILDIPGFQAGTYRVIAKIRECDPRGCLYNADYYGSSVRTYIQTSPVIVTVAQVVDSPPSVERFLVPTPYALAGQDANFYVLAHSPRSKTLMANLTINPGSIEKSFVLNQTTDPTTYQLSMFVSIPDNASGDYTGFLKVWDSDGMSVTTSQSFRVWNRSLACHLDFLNGGEASISDTVSDSNSCVSFCDVYGYANSNTVSTVCYWQGQMIKQYTKQ